MQFHDCDSQKSQERSERYFFMQRPIIRYLCRHLGHMKRDCPKRNRSLCQHKSSSRSLMSHRTLHQHLLLLCVVEETEIVVSIGRKDILTQDPVLEVNNLAAQEVM
ncbi:hypothetical protein TNCV_3368461 [Trichonephila clavipes]|nr:hypothetical protein TNCV_3368461 [Trichonephila clavipes]